MRAGMVKRLADELEARVTKGSDILVAVADEAEGSSGADGFVDVAGQYVEPGFPCAPMPHCAAAPFLPDK